MFPVASIQPGAGSRSCESLAEGPGQGAGLRRLGPDSCSGCGQGKDTMRPQVPFGLSVSHLEQLSSLLCLQGGQPGALCALQARGPAVTCHVLSHVGLSLPGGRSPAMCIFHCLGKRYSSAQRRGCGSRSQGGWESLSNSVGPRQLLPPVPV